MISVDGNFKDYGFVSSSARIAEILDQPSGQFEETDALPDRDRLTYTNDTAKAQRDPPLPDRK